MDTKKNSYWKGVEQLTNSPEFVKNNEKEFPEHLPIKDAQGDNTDADGLNTNRRDFLKLMGFSVAAVSLAACETPVKKAIPYLNKPENVDPGVPNYYASTYAMGSDYCPVVVKTREGRPIHIEGNSFSSFSQGGVNSRVVASIMSLYDNEKAKNATKASGGSHEKIDWASADEEIKSQLSAISSNGGTIYVVTNTNVSPSTHQILADFKAKYPSTKVVSYDQESLNGLVMAHGGSLPTFHFDKADVVVSIGADFLGNWISDVEISPDFAKTRKLGKDKKTMSRHYQFESMMSMTGANADYRMPIKPSQEGLVVAKLYNAVASATGNATISATDVDVDVSKAAADLVKATGKSLVVSGSNDQAVQVLVHGINQMLGNHGTTIDSNQPSYLKQGNDKAMADFISNLGTNDGVIFLNANPVYNHPMGAQLAEKISNAKLSVSTADRIDETTKQCTYNTPDSHFLESWGDFEPKKGLYSLAQPTIRRIFDTRQAQDSFLNWADAGVEYKDYLKKFWEEKLFPLQSKELSFTKFWQRSLHDGIFEPTQGESLLAQIWAAGATEASDEAEAAPAMDSAAAAAKVSNTYKAASTDLELLVYSSPVMGWGEHANNPYIQETPEPITRVCWGNYVAVSLKKALELGVETFETKTHVAKVTVDGTAYNLPIVVQPGLEDNTIAVPVGYGRVEHAGKVAKEAGGENAYPMATLADGMVAFARTSGVSIENTGEVTDVAQTQTHHTIMGRKTIIQETKLAKYQANDWEDDKHLPMIATSTGKTKPEDLSLWDVRSDGYKAEDPRKEAAKKVEGTVDEKPYEGVLWNEKIGLNTDTHNYPIHHWGMAIDLNSCFGCGACVVACHTENNVPIVGKQEVINRREMHWLRIDRYYSNPEGAEGYEELEQAAKNPQVVFQPMMCQHCNNAPCETVCPVAATTHSSEGLNQMTYNRCVGTKYCANNCPFKVRRFNWFKYNNNDEFDYHMNNNLGKMVLNPDVTVRSRGVMEKCSMCVQRIQAGKLQAKREGREVRDGDASIACASACSVGAITFGDLNDESSTVRQLMDSELDDRAYTVLSEINVRPNVWYLSKVRNIDEEAKADS
ncbi:MAG: TAT-variant-translocated molybdopterin oxidoreductase [Flammeovirgaceae bacterium]